MNKGRMRHTSESLVRCGAPGRVRRAFLAFGVIFAFVSSADLQSAPINVHILAGQSNMSGRVGEFYTSSELDGQILYYYETDGPAWEYQSSGGDFETLGPVDGGYYGPEISFGRAMTQLTDDPVALIKISRGDTSLATHWNSRAADGAEMWELWKTETVKALSALEAKGYEVQIESLLWLQGETDALDAQDAANYSFRFGHLVSDMLAHLGGSYDVSETKFVTAGLGPIDEGLYPHAATVTQAQEAVMNALGNGTFIETSDLTLLDAVHFDRQSIDTLGLRFADAVHTPDGIGTRWALAIGILLACLIPRNGP